MDRADIDKHEAMLVTSQESDNLTNLNLVNLETHATPKSLVKLMKMFGQRSKEDLATDPKHWQSFCQVTSTDALSAISRAKTDQCKRELTSVSCMAKRDVPFPDFIPR